MAGSNERHNGPIGLSQPTALAVVGGMVEVMSGVFLPANFVCVVVGLLVCVLLWLPAEKQPGDENLLNPSLLEAPFRLANDTTVFEQYRRVTDSLLTVSRHSDPIYREIAVEQLDESIRQLATIADGTFVFEGTETWRIVYERLLRSPGMHLYRSVAWVKNANYRQDEPGRKSMAVNFELHDTEKLNIERIAIIADELWPIGDVWPTEVLWQWLHEQHAHGIWIKYMRASSLALEPDLIGDIGNYGSRALGIQELVESCRTMRFTLTFDFGQVRAAEDRWKRLSVYAESWSSYLDRYEIPG